MRRLVVMSIAAFVVAAPVVLLSNPGGTLAATGSKTDTYPENPTTKLAGLQHWCGSNGITCAEPATTWGELSGFKSALSSGARFWSYIGHDEPSTLFYSNKPGAGNNVTYQLVLPKDPPTRPVQDGSGGTWGFQLHPTFWFGMVMCDSQGSPNPDGVALTGHATVPCKPDSDSNIYESTDPRSSHYFGLGPGQAYEELQFYPPGYIPWPAGIGCTAKQWCVALNIDTFQDNENTGQFNNNACLNTVGPEPVNFAFLTTSGKASAPANPGAPQHFVPDLKHDLLLNSGDDLTVRLSDTEDGLRTTVVDHTTGVSGSMTASDDNGFGNAVFDPTAKSCTIKLYDYHPEFSTSSPQTRNVNAAHTYNIAFADEIGHGEYCGSVGSDPLSTCTEPLGADTNNGDNKGPDPTGDDDFCLPGSQSLDVNINECLDIDGDFDGFAYNFNWPGSISNPTADQLLHPTSFLFTSPTTSDGDVFEQMAFESDISRDESADTAFRVDVSCQRHIQNPADPQPGTGCVNPPPNSVFYPFYSTTSAGGACWWQEGGQYIPGTTDLFGGSAHAEFGPLRAISYPTAPFGAVTKRYNDFRSDTVALPCIP